MSLVPEPCTILSRSMFNRVFDYYFMIYLKECELEFAVEFDWAMVWNTYNPNRTDITEWMNTYLESPFLETETLPEGFLAIVASSGHDAAMIKLKWYEPPHLVEWNDPNDSDTQGQWPKSFDWPEWFD